MTGKDKCKMLKEIRRKIAEDNDINMVVEECKFQGDCKGTCPKCEAELKELERQVRNKKIGIGVAVTAGAIAATVGGTAAFANLIMSSQLEGDTVQITEEMLEGDMYIPDDFDQVTEQRLEGEAPIDPDYQDDECEDGSECAE